MEALASPISSLVLTELWPLRPGRVAVALLVCAFEVSPSEPRPGDHPCFGSDLRGSERLLGNGDGSPGLVSGGSRGCAQVGTQDPIEIQVHVIHFGKL